MVCPRDYQRHGNLNNIQVLLGIPKRSTEDAVCTVFLNLPYKMIMICIIIIDQAFINAMNWLHCMTRHFDEG